ncbi:MAG: putative hydro-lyase [Gemmobacter sp.]
MNPSHAALKSANLQDVRQTIRDGRYRGHTAGLCPGRLQANLVILPEIYALDFMRFCQRNPRACPLVGVSDTGSPRIETLGEFDLRTDLPAYNIYRDGALADSVTDLRGLWRNDLVAFALGCSFTFETALREAGIGLWHIENDRTVPMFRSTIRARPAGPFAGPMVVSMRTIPAARVPDARAISARFPHAHGAPVHAGDPARIGIADLARPDWGDAAPLPKDHVPVFWACGVTPQAAIAAARPTLCITHKPGHMLITDIPDGVEALDILDFDPADTTQQESTA